MKSFSLWTEDWIPVQGEDGQSFKVSIEKVFAQAHEFRGIHDPSPLITVAIHRLLTALVFCIYEPIRNYDDWMRIWRQGKFSSDIVAAYGEAYGRRFDLLDTERPFYQVPFIEDEKIHPISALVTEASSGNNPALFDHGLVEGRNWLPLDRAACHLIAHQLFAIGGGVSKPFNRMDGPLAKGIIVENIGRNLFETILLNTVPEDIWRLGASRNDIPIWEDDNPPEPDREGTPIQGPRHYLTWQSRQIHLIFDPGQGAITGCQIRQRYCLPRDGSRFDPGKPYGYDRSKKAGWQPRRLRKDRAAWRLTHVLLQPTDDNSSQPDVVRWLQVLKAREEEGRGTPLPSEISFAVSGLTTDPRLAAKVELWRREEIGLPTSIVNDSEKIAQIEDLMYLAERVEWHLQRTATALAWAMIDREALDSALNYLFTGPSGRRKDKMPSNAQSTGEGFGVTLRFWSAMETPFREALHAVAAGDPEIEAMWAARLKELARRAFKPTLEALKSSGRSWEQLSNIENAFERRLAWVSTMREEEAG